MPKFVGKQSANDLIAVLPPSVLGHQPMPRIDQHRQVIGACHFTGLRTPADGHMDAAVVFIPPRLCHGHIFKMSRKDAGREELPVCDSAAFFIEQLFNPLMIHSCHIESSSFLPDLCRCSLPLWGKHRV